MLESYRALSIKMQVRVAIIGRQQMAIRYESTGSLSITQR